MNFTLPESPAKHPRKGKYPNAVLQKRGNADTLLRRWMKRHLQTTGSETSEPLAAECINGNGHSKPVLSEWTTKETNSWSKKLRLALTNDFDLREQTKYEVTFERMQKQLYE